MLFRKTFRNALATLLGMALALAGGAAQAVDLEAAGTDASPYGTNAISIETLHDTSDRRTEVGDDVYYRITLTADDGLVEGQLGVRVPDDREVFIRYTLENMVFARSLANEGSPHASSIDRCVGTVCIPDGDANNALDSGAYGSATVASLEKEIGGTAGENFVVYSVDVGDTLGAAVAGARVIALFHNELSISEGAVGRVTMSTHLTLSDANANRDPLRTKTAPYANPVRSLRTVAGPLPGGAVATVASDFTQLRGGPRQNNLGSITATVGGSPAHKNAQDGSSVTALAHVARAGNADTATGSLLTFAGDFTVGVFSYHTVAANAVRACATRINETSLLRTENARGETRESVSIPAALGITSLCIFVPGTNEEEILPGSYSAAVDYKGLPNAALEPTDLMETSIGSISRDGAVVQIPYLTTYEGYVQRVVIVNRNRQSVNYSFLFHEEDGVTTTAGSAARGSVPGSSKLVLKTTDIVSIAGSKTRTAATLLVVAPNYTIDVATTQVNLDDQGTDTVVYDTILAN